MLIANGDGQNKIMLTTFLWNKIWYKMCKQTQIKSSVKPYVSCFSLGIE